MAPPKLTQIEIDTLNKVSRTVLEFQPIVNKYAHTYKCSCHSCLICWLNQNIDYKSLPIVEISGRAPY